MSEDQEKTLEFIDDYRTFRMLWDTKHKDYTNKVKRNAVLTSLGQKHALDVKMVKNKIKSLRSYFSKEHHKRDGASTYESPWFAYKALSFILDSGAPKESESGENSSQDELFYENATQEGSSDPLATKLLDTEHAYVQATRKRSSSDKSCEEDKKVKIANDADNTDECALFGQLIAHKLRKLNPRNRLLAENRISKVCFDLELEEMDFVILNQDDNDEVDTKVFPR